MLKGIKIKLNYQQWEVLQKCILLVNENAPVKEFELESYVIMDLYKRNMYRITVWDPGGDNTVSIGLKYSEAHALENFFAWRSKEYNIFLRPLIEPKLVPAREMYYQQ